MDSIITDQINSRIKEIEVWESDLKKSFLALEREKKELSDQLVRFKYGVKIGTKVKDRRGRIFVVCSISGHGYIVPWLEGNMIKKDGSPSKRVTCLYGNWEVVGVGE